MMGGPNTLKGKRKRKKISTKPAIDVQDEPSKNQCAFCHKPKLEGNEVERAGNLYQLGNKYFHYFCVLFCQKVEQYGEDDEGLKGFLKEDIEKGLTYGQSQKCCYCGRKGATLRCNKPSVKPKDPRCTKKYHFTCGLQQQKHTFIFTGMMNTFCPFHRPKQTYDLKVKDKTCLGGCQEQIGDLEDSIMISPCCGRKYHLACIQGMASASGIHHFKCPACSVKEQFLDAAIEIGIYVPFQDASWEKDSFYDFESQGRLYQRCDAKICKCPKGREHHLNGTKFEIIRCESCGCGGIHIYCGNLLKQSPLYICEKHSNNERQMLDHIESIKRSNVWNGSDDEYSDDEESFSNTDSSKSIVCRNVIRKTPASSDPTSAFASDDDSDFRPDDGSTETSELDKSKITISEESSIIKNDRELISVDDNDASDGKVNSPEDPYQVQQELTKLFEQSKYSPIKTYPVPNIPSLPFALKHPVTKKRVLLQSDLSMSTTDINHLPKTNLSLEDSSDRSSESISNSMIDNLQIQPIASSSCEPSNNTSTSTPSDAKKVVKEIGRTSSNDEECQLPTIEMIFSMAHVPRDFPPTINKDSEKPEIVTTKIITFNDTNDVVQLSESDDDDVICMDENPSSPTDYSPREDPYNHENNIIMRSSSSIVENLEDNVILLD